MGMELSLKNKCEKVLVVCPKALKEKWKRDWLSWGKSSLPTILSKEEFRKDWQKLPKYDAVIVDEGHYFSGMTSLMSKNLRKYLKKWNVEYVWLLTATPYLSTPWNIYTLAGHLGRQWSYNDFREKFFIFRYVGRREVPVVRDGIEGEIAKLVNGMGSVVRIDECADIPEQVFETEFFKLTKEQEKAIEGISNEEINPIVRFTKFHQIENGTLKGDGYVKDVVLSCDKVDRIADMAVEHKKLAIFCRYNLQIEMLAEKLKDCGKPVYIIRGDVKNRDEITQEIESSDDAVVIINAACSEGYELPTVGVIVFASLSFSYKDYKQACGRFLRINKLKKNVYLHLVSTGSVDEAVYNSIMKKQDFDVEIFADENRSATM